MHIFLQNIIREPEKGRVRMTIQFGDEPPKQFLGEFDGGDGKYKFCNVEQELFMRLSDLGVKRYCNCAIYQMELMAIISAFLSGQSIPRFPIELGMTDFGLTRPSDAKVFFDRIRRPFYLAWSCWKLRHIRRENIKKYGKAARGKT